MLGFSGCSWDAVRVAEPLDWSSWESVLESCDGLLRLSFDSLNLESPGVMLVSAGLGMPEGNLTEGMYLTRSYRSS